MRSVEFDQSSADNSTENTIRITNTEYISKNFLLSKTIRRVVLAKEES